ncbi:MAG: glycosyl transferase family protein [Pseudomonadota bacterium]
MTLAPFVATLGRGPGRSRSLRFEEAQAAMRIMLSGKAAPEAIGALLMLMRMKGETPDEIAGFAQAARTSLPTFQTPPALDWPCYSAGRSRGAPWFLLAARLVAQAGYPVLLHGWSTPSATAPSVRAGLGPAGIAQVTSCAAAEDRLARDGIVYLGLEHLSAPLVDLLSLRAVLGLRSCLNTVVRMLNPGGAAAVVQGVFHPSYRDLQQAAGLRLGLQNLSIIKGGGGEFERLPGKAITVAGLRDGSLWQDTAPALSADVRRLAEGPRDPDALAALWAGTWDDEFARDLVLGTATLALETLGEAKPQALAHQLWIHRHRKAAA